MKNDTIQNLKHKIKFDECNQPYYTLHGITYYGCPGCGACFKETCFCGLCNEIEKYEYINEVINDIPD